MLRASTACELAGIPSSSLTCEGFLGQAKATSVGLGLRGLASAAIDLSDGLVGDLGQILRRSGVGAAIEVENLPISPVLARQPRALQLEFALAGGDDYELLFTAPAAAESSLLSAAAATGVALRRIGRIEAAPGLRLLDARGCELTMVLRGFDHFSA